MIDYDKWQYRRSSCAGPITWYPGDVLPNKPKHIKYRCEFCKNEYLFMPKEGVMVNTACQSCGGTCREVL